jgi:hypothetical protein
MIKKEKIKKPKSVYICSWCLNDSKPTSLYKVTITDFYGKTYQIPVCDSCLEKKEEYIKRYKTFEIYETLHKKRISKKKNAQ